MARWSKIDRRVWGDRWFRSLSGPQPNAQSLWIYLLAGPHGSPIPGLWHLAVETIAARLRWPTDGTVSALEELMSVQETIPGTIPGTVPDTVPDTVPGTVLELPPGWVEIRSPGDSRDPEMMSRFWSRLRAGARVLVDFEAHVVYIPRALAYQFPANRNVVLGWGAAWDEVPESELKDLAFLEMRRFLRERGDAFGEAFDQATGVSGNRSGNGSGNGSGNRFGNGSPYGSPDGSRNRMPTQEQEKEQEKERKSRAPSGAPGGRNGRKESPKARAIRVAMEAVEGREEAGSVRAAFVGATSAPWGEMTDDEISAVAETFLDLLASGDLKGSPIGFVVQEARDILARRKAREATDSRRRTKAEKKQKELDALIRRMDENAPPGGTDVKA